LIYPGLHDGSATDLFSVLNVTKGSIWLARCQFPHTLTPRQYEVLSFFTFETLRFELVFILVGFRQAEVGQLRAK